MHNLNECSLEIFFYLYYLSNNFIVLESFVIKTSGSIFHARHVFAFGKIFNPNKYLSVTKLHEQTDQNHLSNLYFYYIEWFSDRCGSFRNLSKKMQTCILAICCSVHTQSLKSSFSQVWTTKINFLLPPCTLQFNCNVFLSLKQRGGGVCEKWSCQDRERELQYVFENVPSVEPTRTRSVDNYWCLRTTGWQPITSAWYTNWPLACLLL